MLENRKVLTAVIGYISGILMGLYCKISIVLFYILIFLIYLIIGNKSKKDKFKLFSFKRYFRYAKIVFNKKVIKIIIIFSIVSNTIVLFQNYKYENLYKDLDGKNCKFQGMVCNVTSDKVKVKILDNKYKNTYLYIYLKDVEVQYGDKIIFYGTFSRPEKRSNYKGFDKFEYYKTLKIYGSVKCTKVNVLSKNNGNIIRKYTNFFSSKIKQRIATSSLGQNEKSLLEGILLGDKENITEEIKENFSVSNISHLLAVSGMHVSYIVFTVNFIMGKIIGKHYSKLVSSIIIVIYMCMVNFTPSIVRAGITAIIAIMANFVYRKNDIYEALSIALFIILFNNPFSIKDIGLQLSFFATVGIVVFGRNIRNIYEIWLDRVARRAIRKNKKLAKKVIKALSSKIGKTIVDAIIITISATVTVMPIMVLNFNSIAITGLIISVISCFIIGPIMIVGIVFIFVRLQFVEILMNILLNILIKCSGLGVELPLNQIYLVTPKIFEIIIYYLGIFIVNVNILVNLDKTQSVFKERIKNIFKFIKYKLKFRKIISFLLIICMLNFVFYNIPKDLRIYFVDVGQGDCTLIVTPNNKSILIDGGGSEFTKSNFNVGKSILMPYLLDRQIAVVDYVIFSHMDSDHAQGLLYIMENMKVKNAIIGRQFEKSSNYESFIRIAKEKKINVIVVEAGDRINIQKGLYFNVLWPSSSHMISENAINNNSLVCKLVYKNFSMLFTGDIEEVAEKEILRFYENRLDLLRSDCLKVAHHGSKTSSTLGFLNAVNPKMALIGVGKNNNFGHPAEVTLENLKSLNCKVYRTDEMGEVCVRSNGFWIEDGSFFEKSVPKRPGPNGTIKNATKNSCILEWKGV